MSRIVIVVGCFLVWAMPTVDAAQGPPNIVLIMADDLGYGELGCYGQKIIRTPNIDRLAAEGMRFTQCYSGSPVCAPSRCVLMTGKHTGHSFIRNNRATKPEGQWPMDAAELTVAELLKAQGYATAAIGKWGLGMVDTPGDPNRQGFDLFFGFNCQTHAHNHYPVYLRRNDQRVELEGNTRSLTGKQYSQDLFIDEGLQFIRAHREQPFFLYLPFAVPHLSIQVPEESLAEYTDEIREEDYKHKGYLKHPAPRAGYAAMVTHMDRGVGQIMDLLKELKLDDNTLVIFTSDNGPTYNRLGGSDSDFFHSAGEFRGLKGSVYEGGIRVPFVARWPGHIAAGDVSDHLCALWDMLPTLMDVVGAGEKTPIDIDGISLAPTLLAGGDQPAHDHLYWEFAAYRGQQAVRWGQWKGVRQKMFQGNWAIELYDLQDDPGESNDVAAAHPDVVKKIEQLMRSERTISTAFPFPQLDGDSAP